MYQQILWTIHKFGDAGPSNKYCQVLPGTGQIEKKIISFQTPERNGGELLQSGTV